MNKIIESENIRLIAGNEPLLQACLKGNNTLAKFLNITIPEKWSEFGEVVMEYALKEIQKDKEQTRWLTWFPVHKNENLLIGSCGYKGKPMNNTVEIGYEIIETHRNKGYATEAARLLIQNAFEHPGVDLIRAHTLANENASTHVLKKCGFHWVKEYVDPEDGPVWQWELHRRNLRKMS